MSAPECQVSERIEALGQISDEPHRLTRTLGSPAMRRANDLVASWMRQAGMSVREDAIGNIIGRSEAQSLKTRTLLLGSHLDTVIDAGKYDGPLGVLVAIECVERLNRKNTRLPFAVEVIGFCDEEGVRYQTTYLGSKAMAGTFNIDELKRTDRAGITMADAIRQFGGNPDAIDSCRLNPAELIGYVEVHIEQGPVLETKALPVGIVSGIAGQTRARLHFLGQAGHAGTVPMELRRDALCAAAEFVLAVQNYAGAHEGLRATVGEIAALPGASNVIPGEVRLTLDVRHSNDAARVAAVRELQQRASSVTGPRKCKVEFEIVHEAPAVECDRSLSDKLAAAVKQQQQQEIEPILLPSGAGHDAAAMSAIAPVAMLFVRCKGGVSHHPDESVSPEDIGLACDVLSKFLA